MIWIFYLATTRSSGHPPLQLKGPRLFGLENCPPDDLENIFFRACRYTIFKSRYKGPIISLDLFKQLVRDELSVKYRGNRYRRLLERKEEVSAICWHSLAMEGQLFWSLGGELLPVSLFIWESFTALKTLTRHCGGRGLLWKAAMLHAWIELSWIWIYHPPFTWHTPPTQVEQLSLKSENLRDVYWKAASRRMKFQIANKTKNTTRDSKWCAGKSLVMLCKDIK